MGYTQAYALQQEHLSEVLAARDAQTPAEQLGHLLFVVHPPVITVTRRPDAPGHVTATAEQLAAQGVELHQTDRGGDVTYHGPGQLVCYPIIDLNKAKLRLHDYMRLLESAVIDTMTHFNIPTQRDESATGVWTIPADNQPPAKICALGLRVRRWISMHGLAINISTNLEHFNLIVPCGLTGRPVTSMQQELGEDNCPTMLQVQHTLTENLGRHLADRLADHTEQSLQKNPPVS
jgi:lipoyl(octanoyl) transferase